MVFQQGEGVNKQMSDHKACGSCAYCTFAFDSPIFPTLIPQCCHEEHLHNIFPFDDQTACEDYTTAMGISIKDALTEKALSQYQQFVTENFKGKTDQDCLDYIKQQAEKVISMLDIATWEHNGLGFEKEDFKGCLNTSN